VCLFCRRGLFRTEYPGTTLRESLGLDNLKNQSHNNKREPAMQKTSLILALALAFTPAVWAENVNINGTGVSIEANKTPVNTAKNSAAVAQLPKDYRFAVPGNLPWRWRR
jgi:hypothetical protein